MEAIELGKAAARTVWRNKYLWFFGAFVAAGGGGGGGAPPGGGKGAGASRGAEAWQGLPEWAWALIIVGSIVALAASLLHVLSEAALIEGVRRDRARPAGERPALGIRKGIRLGLSFFWRVLGIKFAFGAVTFATVGVCAAPVTLGIFELVPLAVGIIGTVLLALPAVPFLLTAYFLYEYTLRFCVLEDLALRAAWRRAFAYLHGRIVPSLQLLLVALVGRIAGGVVAGMALVPVALLALGLYFAGGLPLAIGAGVLLGLPVALLVTGALGAYNSAVWTLGVLD